MKYLTSLITVVLFTCNIFSQDGKAEITFDVLQHDFGVIEEKDGIVYYDFSFKNTGSLPLILSSVTASCGCTTPKWSKKPILPGQEDVINVGYNPKNRPGEFNKTIAVRSNASKSEVYLRINGTVHRDNNISDIYKYSIGSVKFTSLHAVFGTILMGESKKKIIELMNTSSNESVELKFKSFPEYLNIEFSPQVLKPGEKGKLEIEFNGEKVNDWGILRNRLSLLINGKPSQGGVINVTADIREDFTCLTPEQKANAPIIHFDEKSFDFGELNEGKTYKHIFKISNNGKSELIFRKVKASCGCTVAQPKKNKLEPGKSTGIEVSFNTKGKSGNQKHAITIITNDPNNYKTILWIKGIITSKQ